MATLAALDGGSGAACAQLRAAAPSAGLFSSAVSVRRASPARRAGGRCRHSAPPLVVGAGTVPHRFTYPQRHLRVASKRLRWNSCCSATRWITAPSPRPVDQPSTNDTATKTTTTPTTSVKTDSQHYDDYLAHRDTASHANPQQPHLASPTRAAQQAAALILVAAQHDISHRDGTIGTLRSRWWQQLCSHAIHITRIKAQQRRVWALRCAHQETQQLAAQELQLEDATKARTR